jgi:hypothetical protein
MHVKHVSVRVRLCACVWVGGWEGKGACVRARPFMRAGDALWCKNWGGCAHPPSNPQTCGRSGAPHDSATHLVLGKVLVQRLLQCAGLADHVLDDLGGQVLQYLVFCAAEDEGHDLQVQGLWGLWGRLALLWWGGAGRMSCWERGTTNTGGTARFCHAPSGSNAAA